MKTATFKELLQMSVFAETQIELDTILAEIKTRKFWMS